jgi:hypothetical protein
MFIHLFIQKKLGMFIHLFLHGRPLSMCVRRRRPPTLDLRLEMNAFPVKRTKLFEKLGLFQNSPALLGAQYYEVQTWVPPQLLKAFVRIVEGGPLVVSESTRRYFSLLAEEFGFEELSVACRELTASGEGSGERGKSSSVETARVERPRVTITSRDRSTTYESLHSVSEIIEFVDDLEEAKEHCIVLEGIDGRDRVVEQAVEIVYSNTVADFGDEYPKNPFLALTLWKMRQLLFLSSVNSSIYCLNRFHEMAPTAFDKARLLLLSQCDSGSYGSFVPLARADWEVIDDALTILKSDTTDEAAGLLKRLKDTGRYDIFEHWESEGSWPISPSQKTEPKCQSGGAPIHLVKETRDKRSWFRRLFKL